MSEMPSDALLQRLAPLAPVPDLPEIVAHQANDLFALWQGWEEQRNSGAQEPPFWATVWPAARLLGRWLLDNCNEVAGRDVLELGCGGGVVAIAAARCGARRVIANDIDAVALHLAGRNAAANGVTLELDVRDLSRGELPTAEVILVADMFYERSVSERFYPLLQRAAAAGATVLVGDGGRPFTPRQGMEPIAERELAVDFQVEGAQTRRVRIMKLLAAR